MKVYWNYPPDIKEYKLLPIFHNYNQFDYDDHSQWVRMEMKSQRTANGGYNYFLQCTCRYIYCVISICPSLGFLAKDPTSKSIAQDKGFGPPSCYTNNVDHPNNILQSCTWGACIVIPAVVVSKTCSYWPAKRDTSVEVPNYMYKIALVITSYQYI